MTLPVDAMPWIAALGWTLLHFLWQGAIVAGVFALVRASISRHACNARYANGLIALASMAVLPVATFFTLLSRQADQAEVLPLRDAVVDAGTPATIGSASQSMAAAPFDGFLPWIVGFWLLGVVLVGLHSWRQWRHLAQVARRWAEPDAQLQQVVVTLAYRFDFMRRIRVLVSDRIDTPTLIGWIKPVILLPAAVAIGFPRQQVELILAHELGHLRRYDHVVNLAQAILENLLFYHPAVHWIAREVRNEREICCDTLVLRVTGGEPREYAQTLAALEELRQPPVQLALAANGGELLERVRRILFAPHPAATQVGRRMWLPAILTVAVALIVATGLDRPDAMQFEGPASLPQVSLQPATTSWEVPDIRPAQYPARPKFIVAEPVRPVAPPTPERQLAANDATPAVAPAPAAAVPTAAAVPAATTAPTAMALAPAIPQAGAKDADQASVSTPQSAVADADAHVPSPPSVAAAPVRRMPVATRTLAPEYPASAHPGHRARVELKFAVGPRGAVRDISVVSEPSDPAFARAARRALEQWRFDPATVDGMARYRQAFVFAPPSLADANQETSGCIRRTGTLLCQRGENADVADDEAGKGERTVAAGRDAGTREAADAMARSSRSAALAADAALGSAP